MKSFKEFSLNIIPKGHKRVKIMQSNAGEVMVTKDKSGKFNVMFDNQAVEAGMDNERQAMKAAQDFVKMIGKSRGAVGAKSSEVGGKRAGRGGYFK